MHPEHRTGASTSTAEPSLYSRGPQEGSPRWRTLLGALGTVAAGLHPSLAAAEEPAAMVQLPETHVVGNAPLGGLGLPLSDVAGNVQTLHRRDMAAAYPGTLADALEASAPSVNLNSGQGNPFQNNVNFRGFAASPLLGTPQGLSVFVDGVRVNEPFGDVVNWDLIPQSAIAHVSLVPGINPLFGLNTLGGALSITTRSGLDSPGGAVELTAGSFGRRAAQFEYGTRQGPLHYFISAHDHRDDGWAMHNPSSVRQLFGKVGWKDARTDVSLSANLADNRLEGTQSLPLSFFDNIRQPYTWPDANSNRLAAFTLKGTHTLSDHAVFDANAYVRKYNSRNVSSNVNDDFDSLTDPAQAFNHQSRINQNSYGAAAQLTVLADSHQLVFGASSDFGRSHFTQSQQEARFTANRGTISIGDFEPQTDANTRNAYYGLYAADTWHLAPQWTLNLAGRYNLARVSIRDNSGDAPALNADHSFNRFSPSAGLNYNPTNTLTAYANYSEGMRAPTPIELACADPNAPCSLPNQFLADPPLKPVISRTFELGMRGRIDAKTHWSMAVFRSALQDDIQFISSGGAGTSTGYFSNVGRTRRQGMELSGQTSFGPLSVTAGYSYVDARYLTPFSAHSPSNSSADGNGDIQVDSGSRIPGIPQHTLKLRLGYDVTPQWKVDAALQAHSGVYALGDENNGDRNGKVPGFATVNLDTRYQITPQWELSMLINNLFNRRYANFGQIGQNFFTGPGRTFGPPDTASVPEQFRAPGTPRGIWISLRYRFGTH